MVSHGTSVADLMKYRRDHIIGESRPGYILYIDTKSLCISTNIQVVQSQSFLKLCDTRRGQCTLVVPRIQLLLRAQNPQKYKVSECVG